MLFKLEAKAAPDWPPGVYTFGGDLFRARITVTSELPRDRSTLLARIMAAGPALAEAISDLASLPADAHERTVAEQILVHLQHALGKKPGRPPGEDEIMARIKGGFDDMRDEGRLEGSARAVLTALRVRGIVVSDADRERILSEKTQERLERWLERAIVAEVLTEPIQAA